MGFQVDVKKKIFSFVFDARTSRGAMKEKTSWFVIISEQRYPFRVGIGECSPLPGLSIDFRLDMEKLLEGPAKKLGQVDELTSENLADVVRYLDLEGLPSVSMAFETALHDWLHGGVRTIFPSSDLAQSLPINGLIWMGDYDFMQSQVDQKIQEGFDCIKIKIGGIDFEEECRLLAYIRTRYNSLPLTIRLDANGSLEGGEALDKLKILSTYRIHSIEQPLAVGNPFLSELCEVSPIAIALDEELIGKEHVKGKLLDTIKPQYLIIKPSLHGGFIHSGEWIKEANKRTIGWWITSALESNIGLNAICQFTRSYQPMLPQGLGTGGLYRDNFTSPWQVSMGKIVPDETPWDLSFFGI